LLDLHALRSTIDAQPTKQDELDARALKLIDEIKEQKAEQREQFKNRERLDDFFRSRQSAFTHDTEFTGLEPSSNREATRSAARAALDVFAAGAPPDAWALESLPASFSADEKDRVREGCYELLLILAEAVAEPAESLRLLAQAATLRAPDRTFHFRRAAYLSKKGDVSGAEAERRAADATPLATPVDHFLAGREQFKRGDYAGANRNFDATRLRQPDHFWARCLSSLCVLQLRQEQLAWDRLSECIRSEPGNAWLRLWRGLASMQLAAKTANEEKDHHFKQALDDFDQVLELLAQKPDNLLSWVLLVNRGNLFVQHADWEKASADFQAAARLDAHHIDSLVGLAQVYQRQHKPDEAIEQFSRAIALKPDMAALYRGRAAVNLARNGPTADQRAKALSDLDQAIRLESPTNPVVAVDQTRRAILLREAHRLPEALSASDAAVKVDSNRKESHLLRIQVLLELNRFDDVIRSCDALLAMDKTSAWVYELRGLARASLKNLAGAIEDDTQAIALEPQEPLLYLRRGDIYLVLDSPRLAMRDFDEAVRLDPSSGDALTGRAAARVRLGEHREAILDVKKALALGTTTAKQLYSATKVYARAAAVAGAQVRTKGREYVSLVENYQDRGVALLSEAIKKLPLAERAAFWRDVVQKDPDPAMNVLRRRLRATGWDDQARLIP
jgi:eukaryotic-like serine/threonine-protein kinase